MHPLRILFCVYSYAVYWHFERMTLGLGKMYWTIKGITGVLSLFIETYGTVLSDVFKFTGYSAEYAHGSILVT